MSIRTLLFFPLFLGLGLVGVRPVAAISVIEPIAFGSYRIDPETGSLGVGAALGVASIDVVPMVEYVFVEDASDMAITVDGHFPLMALPVVAFYLGGGASTYRHDPDQGDDSWDTGINFLIGGKATVRKIKPFAEVKYTTAGLDGWMLTLGMRFNLRGD